MGTNANLKARTMAKHWQPKPDKHCLVDDLNDWLNMYGSTPIDHDTKMTVEEIEAISYAFSQANQRKSA